MNKRDKSTVKSSEKTKTETKTASFDYETSADKIYSFFKKNLRMPSYAEICTICNIKSKNTAHNLVKRLRVLRYIDIDKAGKIIPIESKLVHKSFTQTFTQDSRSSTKQTPSSFTTPLTLLGLVEAGFPTPSEESLHENISLDDWVIDRKEASFMLKVKGDSMRDAGILDGDMVIVERTNSPKVGQIVVAEVDGSYTMKYFKKDKTGRAYLEAANPDFDPIYPENDLRINAVVKAVVRKYTK